MSTYDRVSEKIMSEKIRIENIIRQNEELRNKCIESLKICQAELTLALGVTK